jgi:hypothetical protein
LPSRAWGRLILSSRSARALLAIVIAAAIWLPGLPFTMHGELLLTAMNLVLTVATVVIVLRCGTQRRGWRSPTGLRVRASFVARLHGRHQHRERGANRRE